jgi:hypothetical protein
MSKRRRAYIAWEDDEVSSTKSDSENDEIDQLCFMGQRKKSIEVSDRNSNFFFFEEAKLVHPS